MSFEGHKKAYQAMELYCKEVAVNDPLASSIEQTPNGEFKLAFYVHESFYGGLIGSKGSTKHSIQENTKTQIYFPRSNEEPNEVIIRAKHRNQVCDALGCIRFRMISMRRKMSRTHILAVALNFGEVQERYVELKKCILEAQLPGIHEGLFISKYCLHYTIGVFVLLDEKERQKALKVLDSCRSQLADLKTPFEMKVKGLVTNDNPSLTRVLHGCIESPDLKKFADRCNALYENAGLSLLGTCNMRMKIMNIRFREEATNKDTFDASEIVERFGNFDFGTAICQEVHLCELGSRGEDKFYNICRSLQI
ncbi:activating signal cointegrator 1 complex subunit 1-like [Drosophila takahashii]|uniref:activating signal cointegrator 1 complex subunit 1-like n=1 Tax=Drosophila takahashii TaxID=29030 RepID=UPI001CF8122F|nr:activating signal cointegrator 1 complex subunit 1-like [Drosophila takahashii]